MTDTAPSMEDAAAKVAFSLLRDAYFDLAQTLLRIEEEPARDLLRRVEQRTALRLTSLDEAAPDGTDAHAAFALAAQPVRAVLREAQAA